MKIMMTRMGKEMAVGTLQGNTLVWQGPEAKSAEGVARHYEDQGYHGQELVSVLLEKVRGRMNVHVVKEEDNTQDEIDKELKHITSHTKSVHDDVRAVAKAYLDGDTHEATVSALHDALGDAGMEKHQEYTADKYPEHVRAVAHTLVHGTPLPRRIGSTVYFLPERTALVDPGAGHITEIHWNDKQPHTYHVRFPDQADILEPEGRVYHAHEDELTD